MKKIIRDEIDYQRRRIYKRLKTSDTGKIMVEHWAGAMDFLNTIHGITWEIKDDKIMIQEKRTPIKKFLDIYKEGEGLV